METKKYRDFWIYFFVIVIDKKYKIIENYFRRKQKMETNLIQKVSGKKT